MHSLIKKLKNNYHIAQLVWHTNKGNNAKRKQSYNCYLQNNSKRLTGGLTQDGLLKLNDILPKLALHNIDVWITPLNFLYADAKGSLAILVSLNDKHNIYIDPLPHLQGVEKLEFNEKELMSTICHELTHVTGAILGRYESDNQPELKNLKVQNKIKAYVEEEYVAVYGELILVGGIDHKNLLNNKPINTFLEEVKNKCGFVGEIDKHNAIAQAVSAVRYIQNVLLK